MQIPPIKTAQVANICTITGTSNKFMKHMSCSMQSQKYITIKDEDNNGVGQLTIISPQKNMHVDRKPNKSQGAIMHKNQNIISLKAGNDSGKGQIVQIFNFDKKVKIKHCQFNQNISFWHWVSDTKLIIVCSSIVYILDISKQDEPQIKLMQRYGPLADGNPVQIIGVHLSNDQKWAALNGISTPDGGKTINGHIQLFLIQGAKQQILQGYTCCFSKVYIHNDSHMSNIYCYAQKKVGDINIRIHINEISPPPQGYPKHKKNCQMIIDQQGDFPIFMQVSQKYGILNVVTKLGLLYIYELTTTQLIYKTRMANQTLFTCCKNQKNNGLLAIGKSGAIYSSNVDEPNLVPYILNNCQFLPNCQQLAFGMAGRYNLPGLQNIFLQQFNKLMALGDYNGAAKVCASAPQSLLRNQDTIKRFRSLPNQPQSILIYFQKLLQKGKLNKIQTLQLCHLVISQGKGQAIKNWFQNGKLFASEQLGDMVFKVDKQIGLKIFKQLNNHNKIVMCLNDMGMYDQAMKYASQTGVSSDYVATLRNLLQTSPQSALNFAKNVYSKNKQMKVHQVADLFMAKNRIQQMTAFLVQCMQDNKAQDANYQTKVLEMNIMSAPSVAEAIFQMGKWTQFNKPKIANLCEQRGLFQRALQNYNEAKDIKRILNNAQMMPEKFVVEYFSKLSPDIALQCLSDMIKFNRQNVKLVVSICMSNHSKYGTIQCCKVFESAASYDGLFYFLGAIDKGTDKDVYYKYIEAAAKCGQFRNIQQIIKSKPDCYDVTNVKNLLFDLRLADPKPLIILCDIHYLVEELIKYLYKNNFQNYIEVYLFKVNTNSAAIVLGTLIDLQCQQSYIKKLLLTLRSNCPMQQLIQQFIKRNRLRVMQQWLNQRVQQGVQIVQIHNALAMVKIDTNQQPNEFLANNQIYDSKIIGKFCQQRDPHLAVVAYKRAWGKCDNQLIMITNKNSLFRIQAKYLVQRQSKQLWKSVLSPDNPYRKQVVQQIVSSALPQSKNFQQITIAVQAFLAAELQMQLMSLLQKIVIHNTQFGKYKKLQNLLIITAIKSDTSRVMDYIKKLDNYDGPQIAKIALGQKYNLFQQAFVIYSKQKMSSQAMSVLIDYIGDIQRAADFAQQNQLPDVWSKLGTAFVEKGDIVQAVECYIKAKDPSHYIQVINLAQNEQRFDILIKFLPMARQQTKDQIIDNSYIFALAKLNKNNELQQFISNPNSADIQRVGDRCFNDKLYQSAKYLYTSIRNNAKISSCLVFLGQFSAAIQSAKKANTPKTWKDLCMACVAAQQYKLANTAGMHIIVHPDHLQDLINHYQANGVAQQMINLLQTGMGLQKAHIGIFTQLGILYAKYKSDRLISHCKAYMQNINVPKLLRICQKYQLWPETVFLYSNYNEPDRAANIMIEHSPSCFQHQLFIQIMQKVSNNDIYYRAITFYLEQQPMSINQLLKGLSKKIDLTKCVATMRRTGYLPLIVPFLKTVQAANNKQVNQALNEIFLEEYDHKALRQSISRFQNFDSLSLARLTQKHEFLQFRRISAFLFRKIGKYEQSIALSKNDQIYRDAIQTTCQSQKQHLIQQLLRFFVQKQEKEFFSVTLYTCYKFLKPDLVLQLAWRYGLYDFAMPFMIQFVKDTSSKLELIHKKTQNRQKKEKKEAEKPSTINNYMMPVDTPMLMQGGQFSTGGIMNMQNSGMNLGASMNTGMGGINTGNTNNDPNSGFGQFSTWHK